MATGWNSNFYSVELWNEATKEWSLQENEYWRQSRGLISHLIDNRRSVFLGKNSLGVNSFIIFLKRKLMFRGLNLLFIWITLPLVSQLLCSYRIFIVYLVFSMSVYECCYRVVFCCLREEGYPVLLFRWGWFCRIYKGCCWWLELWQPPRRCLRSQLETMYISVVLCLIIE